MSNVLLIGGCGFLGKNLVNTFLEVDDISIYTYDISELVIPKTKSFIGNVENINYIKDIIKGNNINKIIYLVSSLLPASDYVDFQKEMNVIYSSMIELLMFCSQQKVDFIFFSSGGTVYGLQSGILKETDNTNPISFYGLAKVQIENLIKFYHQQFGLNYLIIRPSNPYGYGQNLYGKQGIIAVAIGKTLNNKPIDVYGDGGNIRDYIFIEDFCHYMKYLIVNRVINKTLNIGSGIGYSINDVLNIIEKVTRKKLIINYIKKRNTDVPSIIMDISELNKIVKYKQVDLEMGIMKFYKNLIG